ncbi:MAG: YHS domain-containing protein, partial [archaeon]
MAKAIDPICKMTVDTGAAKFVSSVGGKKTYFCSGHCKDTFEKQFAEKKSGAQKKPLPIASQTAGRLGHDEKRKAQPMRADFSGSAGNG